MRFQHFVPSNRRITTGAIVLIALMTMLPTSSALGQRQNSNSGTQVSNAQNGNNFLIYANATYGIRISYPKGWRKIEADYVTFQSDDLSQWFGGFAPSVIVGSEQAYGLSLSEYTTESVKSLKEDLDAFMIIEASKPGTLSGNIADRIVFTFNNHGTPIKGMAIWTVSNGEAFLIVYISHATSYSLNLGKAEFMINSFQINTDIGRSALNIAMDIIHKNFGNIIQLIIIGVIIGLVWLLKRIRGRNSSSMSPMKKSGQL